jgi:hypothetical protein
MSLDLKAEAAAELRPAETTIDTGWENSPTLEDLKYDLEQAQSHQYT